MLDKTNAYFQLPKRGQTISQLTKITYYSLFVIQLSSQSFPACGSVQVSVDIQNTGKVLGDEVVQIYMSFKVVVMEIRDTCTGINNMIIIEIIIIVLEFDCSCSKHRTCWI